MELATPGSALEATLWRRYKQGADTVARDALVACHLPFARVVAAMAYARRYNDEVEFGDYLQFASVGLLEALERFEPSRGVQFRTFASRRMQGAILSGLEGLTEKLQQIAARQRMRAERLQHVKEMALAGRTAPASASPELADFVVDVGIGLALCWILEGTGLVDRGDASGPSCYESLAMKELRTRLLEVVDALPPTERAVIRGHYLQHVAFEEIARSLQLTKGRVSQIHKQALLRLRAAMRDGAAWEASF
jgi:RNA polymerase sigma factor for flagellar operon FliA